MAKETSMIESLTKQVQQMKAGEGHIVLGSLHGNPKLTAVISVYDGQNPSHAVLDRVYEWAEGNDPKLVELINSLSVAKLD